MTGPTDHQRHRIELSTKGGGALDDATVRVQNHDTIVGVLENQLGATMARPGDIIALCVPDPQPTTGASKDIAEPATTT